jgi:hypothetical protein
MTTDYEKQLEEDNISLKNLLDERTRELDEAKASLKRWEDDLMVNKPGRLSPGVPLTDIDIASCNISSSNAFTIKTNICMDGEMFTADDVVNLKHLWSLHKQKENKPPLLYRIWRKITSCLTTKKN